MDVIFTMSWWLVLMRGLAALVLGILTLTLYNITAYELALLFFGYAMADSIANAAGAVTAIQKHERWGLLLLQAVVGFVAAILIVAWPGSSLMGMVYIISGWGIVTGSIGIISSVRLRRYHRGRLLLALSGLASAGLGIVMAALPLAGPSAVELRLGAYAFISGAIVVALALRLRTMVEINPNQDVRAAA